MPYLSLPFLSEKTTNTGKPQSNLSAEPCAIKTWFFHLTWKSMELIGCGYFLLFLSKIHQRSVYSFPGDTRQMEHSEGTCNVSEVHASLPWSSVKGHDPKFLHQESRKEGANPAQLWRGCPEVMAETPEQRIGPESSRDSLSCPPWGPITMTVNPYTAFTVCQALS